MFTRTDVTNIAITPTYTTSGGTQLVVTGSGSVATKFMGSWDFHRSQSTSRRRSNGATADCASLWCSTTPDRWQTVGKITALKTATNNLLTQLKNAVVNNGDVYVSIIPFVKDVNVDPVNYNQNWIDWTDWDSNNGTCSNS